MNSVAYTKTLKIPCIEEQTTQWSKEKVEKDTQRSTRQNTNKTKDRVIRTPLKTGVNSGAPESSEVPAPLVRNALIVYTMHSIFILHDT